MLNAIINSFKKDKVSFVQKLLFKFKVIKIAKYIFLLFEHFVQTILKKFLEYGTTE